MVIALVRGQCLMSWVLLCDPNEMAVDEQKKTCGNTSQSCSQSGANRGWCGKKAQKSRASWNQIDCSSQGTGGLKKANLSHWTQWSLAPPVPEEVIISFFFVVESNATTSTHLWNIVTCWWTCKPLLLPRYCECRSDEHRCANTCIRYVDLESSGRTLESGTPEAYSSFSWILRADFWK